jgi:hypothetical protein
LAKGVFDEDSSAVQAHAEILQRVIGRMATNSTSCKAWCLTLVSAILVLVAGKGNQNNALIAQIPTALFFVLDGYYLALEREFIGSYNDFVKGVHHGTLKPNDFYSVEPPPEMLRKVICAMARFATWPFYVTLGVVILVIRAAL